MRLFIAAFLAVQPCLAAAASLTSFDLPGYSTTCATAIASNGAVTGTASRGSIKSATGFIFINGHFSFPKPDEPPGAIEFTGINTSLALVGFDLESGELASTSFVYQNGRTLVPPLAASSASFYRITDDGTLLGSANFEPAGQIGSDVAVFLLSAKGKLTKLDDGSGFMVPEGVDEHGDRVVGYSFGPTGYAAWSYYQGAFTTIAAPEATVMTAEAAVTGKGVIYGTFYAGTAANPVAHGFVLQHGTYTVLNVPGADDTQITDANESGQFVGCYKDKTGVHGFIATP